MAWNELATMANLSDVAAAAALSAMTNTVRRPPERWRVKDFIYANGIYAALLAAQRTAQQPLLGVIETTLAVLDDRDYLHLDVDNAAMTASFAALKQAGILTDAQIAAILALAEVVEQKYGFISSNEVAAARAAL
jgi:hypothetical protein